MKTYQNQKFDIILLAGQSNAEGYGVGQVTEAWIPSEKILWLNDDSHPRFEKNEEGKEEFHLDYPSLRVISTADEPLCEQGKLGKFSFSFAKAYVEDGKLEEGRKLLIVNAAVGGTGFRDNQWGLQRALYLRLKDFTRFALSVNNENRLVAFLWHQGECDSFENAEWSVEKRYATHRQNLSEMFADFKEEFACPHLPIIAGGFVDEWYLKNKTPCDSVLKAIREVCDGFVDTTGLQSNNQATGNGDDIHFSRESLRILGEKYYQIYKDLEK